MIRPAHGFILVLLALAACSGTPSRDLLPAGETRLPSLFSLSAVIDGLPEGWKIYRLLRFKPLTQYAVVPEGGTNVVHAVAASSASGLNQQVSVDLREFPLAEWRWKVPKLIADADNSQPARVVFTFEGTREQLPDDEKLNYDLAKALTGNPLPYATLMYIWEPNRREGEIVTHHNSSRVKMVIAGNAERDLTRWHDAKVNVLEDFRRAFGEEPPRIKSVGIMSDSDNTGVSIEAFYGDIRFLKN